MVTISRALITRFIGTGILVALVQYATFHVLYARVHLAYLPASTLSFCITVVVSFILQYVITFQKSFEDTSHGRIFTHFSLFFLNALFGLLLNGAVMYGGVQLLHVSPYVVQVVSMGFLACYNFFAYRILLG
jgi:putative flippase GtrA